MPSPIIHIAAGAGICALDPALRRNRLVIVLVMLAAILPDFDVLPGMLLGDPNRFHNGLSHSVGAALIAATCAAVAVGRQYWRAAIWVGVSWMTHAALDALTLDRRPPYGVPLFWPFVAGHVSAATPVFRPFRHGYDRSSNVEFLHELLSLENARTIAFDSLVGGGFVACCGLVAWLIARRKEL